MLKILSRDDYSLLKAFFPKEYPLDELLNPVNGSRILCAMIEKKITSLIIVNLIKNQYYQGTEAQWHYPAQEKRGEERRDIFVAPIYFKSLKAGWSGALCSLWQLSIW